MPTVKPLDEDAILRAARDTGGIVTVEEHNVPGGLGEAVAALVSTYQPCLVRRVGIQDVFGESGQAAELPDKYHMRAADATRAAVDLISRASA